MYPNSTRITHTVMDILLHAVIAPKPMSGCGNKRGIVKSVWQFRKDITEKSNLSLLPRTEESANVVEIHILNFSKSTTLMVGV